MSSDKSEFSYINRVYRLYVKKWDRIKFQGRSARVVGAQNGRLVITYEGEKQHRTIHPTWEVKYQ